jgi:hypothetical protein
MNRTIRVTAGVTRVTAELNSTRTAQAIWDALPLKGRTNIWGDEIYFSIPINLELENGQELVSKGDLAYWPSGPAFCIFFGPTPMSQGQEIRPAGPVTVLGRVTGDTEVLRQVAPGAEITIEREEQN